jgi:hypothetical protein
MKFFQSSEMRQENGNVQIYHTPLLLQPITAHPRARPTIYSTSPFLVQPITVYPRALPTNHRARHLLSTSPIVRPSSVTDYPPARLFGTPAPSFLLSLSLSPRFAVAVSAVAVIIAAMARSVHAAVMPLLKSPCEDSLLLYHHSPPLPAAAVHNRSFKNLPDSFVACQSVDKSWSGCRVSSDGRLRGGCHSDARNRLSALLPTRRVGQPLQPWSTCFFFAFRVLFFLSFPLFVCFFFFFFFFSFFFLHLSGLGK